MELKIKLPDFLIIGAQKAGTTSLYYYCKQHPHIFMSNTKEPMFFNSKRQPEFNLKESNFKHPYSFFTLAEYAALFAKAGRNQIMGEASTAYLANPEAALLIKKIVPNVKIIAILRNPLIRAYSAYSMYVERGVETRSFEEAILSEAENRNSVTRQGQLYLTLGLYAAQLRPYINLFPKQQIYIGDYDEYNQNNVEFLQKIFRFLNVKEFVPNDLKRFLVSDKGTSHATPRSTKFDNTLAEKIKPFFEKDIEILKTMVDFDVTKWFS